MVSRSGAIVRGNGTPTSIQKNYSSDDAGMVVALTDERGNKTTLSHDSTDVLPSKITAPYTLSGGTPVSHAVTKTYDPATDVLLTRRIKTTKSLHTSMTSSAETVRSDAP